MNKLWVVIAIYSSLSIGMQRVPERYDRKATNALVEILNRDDFGAMKTAEIQKEIDDIKKQINAGADPNVRPIYFYTPLLFAINYYEQDPSLIDFLLSKGANPAMANFGRIKPLEFAISKRKEKPVQLLLNAGADVNTLFAQNEIPLTLAIRKAENLVPLLLKRGADFKNKRALTLHPPVVPHVGQREIDPLALAIILGKTDAAKLLMEAGANVNQTYQGGSTPLMLAAAGGNRNIVQSLIEYGAVDYKDKPNTKGETAWDIAHKKGYTEIEKLLRKQKIP